jgi:hypothetical protein
VANEKLEPIGVQAQFDIDDFKKNQAQYDALLNKASASTDKFYQQQQTAAQKAGQAAIANSRRVVEAAQAQEKAQTEAVKKTTTETQKGTEAQTKSVNQYAAGLRHAAILVAGSVAAIVLAYKKLGEAAKEFGDKQAIAEFERLNVAVSALEDTLLAAGLEFNRLTGISDFFAGIATTISQSVSIATGYLIYFAKIATGLPEIIKAGWEGGGLALRAKLAEIAHDAKAAAELAFMATVTAPQRSAQTAILEEQEKEANKQREKTAQNIVDYHEKIRDLQIKSGEDILAAEKDFQDKSADAWATYIEKANDIIADGVKKRADLARTLSDAIASAELDYQRGSETASYNHGQKLADIERDYQNTIRNIQQQYSEDSLDAIRNLDAIGLIRAREKRDKDLVAARTGRDQANAAENTNYQRQLFELQRALEDKKREAERAYQRGLEDQQRAESEALRDAKGEYNKQKAAAKTAFDEKLAAIQQAYRNEDAAASAHYAGQEAALTAHLRAMQAIMARYNIGGGTPTSGGGGVRGRAMGGLDIVNQATQFVAGEAGPEMVFTAPLNRNVPVSVPQIVNHTGDFSHSIDAAVRSSVSGIDGRIVAAVTKVLREVLG